MNLQEFHDRCQMYCFYRRQVEYLREEEKYLSHKQVHVHSVHWQETYIQKQEFNPLDYIQKKQELESRIKEYKNQMKEFEDLFTNNDAMDWILWSVYVDCIPVKEVAEKIHMHPNSLSRKIQMKIQEM